MKRSICQHTRFNSSLVLYLSVSRLNISLIRGKSHFTVNVCSGVPEVLVLTPLHFFLLHKRVFKFIRATVYNIIVADEVFLAREALCFQATRGHASNFTVITIRSCQSVQILVRVKTHQHDKGAQKLSEVQLFLYCC